jgi:ribosomal protein S18 acetylase RimI-like enzyme
MRSFSLPPVPQAFSARGLFLRPAVSADAEFMREVYIAGRWAELAVTGWPEEIKRTFLRDQYRLQTLHYDQHYADAARMVVEREGEPVGKLVLGALDTEVRIIDIGLLPAWRGRGIGEMLITFVQEAAAGSGHRRVTLHVESNNPAKSLYRRLGFRLIEERGIYEFLAWDKPMQDEQ